jgi:predicted outer membrane repeat protein
MAMACKRLLFSLSCLTVLVLLNQHLTLGALIQVPNENGNLSDYLCGTQSIISGTVLELNPEITHTISQQFCLWQNRENITVQSSQEGAMAIVRCDINASTEYTQSGFGFVEMSSLTLRNIRFENCGGIMENADLFADANTAPRRAINIKQHAVLFMSRCNGVNIENVAFSNYRGYAIYAINLVGQNLLQGVTVTESYAYRNETKSLDGNDLKYSGSGIFLHFSNESTQSRPKINTVVNLLNSNFTNNFNIYPESFIKSLEETRLQNQPPDFPFHGAGGLTLHFEQQDRLVMVHVEDSHFINNSGTAGGGGKIVTRDTLHNSNIIFTGCTFISNSIYRYSKVFAGSGLEIHFVFSYSKLSQVRWTNGSVSTTASIEHSIFQENLGEIGAAISMFTEAQDIAPIKVNLKHVKFIDNEATIDGDCIIIESENAATYSEKRPNITLESITVQHSGRENDLDTTAALSFNNIFVTINGTKENPSIISNGKNGALKLFNTYTFLTGEVQFVGNRALLGGAIFMEANSYLLFLEPANILFKDNRANKGGAIYSDIVRGLQCVMQYITYANKSVALNQTQLKGLDFNLTFIDNIAESDGHAIYAQPIYNCNWFSESVVQVPTGNVMDVYEKLFHFQSNQRMVNYESQINTHPFRPCFCEVVDEKPMCSQELSHKYSTKPVPPGRSFIIPIVPADEMQKPVQSVVEVELVEDFDNDSDDRVRFQSNNLAHFVKDLNSSACYPAKLSLRNVDDTTVVIKFSVQGAVGQSINVTVNLEECPFGFQLNKSSSTGICECVPIFANNGIKCDIENSQFTKPAGTYWIGKTRFEENTPACAVRCPDGYCQRNTTVDLGFENQCIGDRMGEMCGQCKPNLSIQFGTTDCHKCSNYWLFTIILYIFAGILLVISLFLLRLTISDGLLASLLFYAQLFSINLGLLVYSNETRFTTVFISLLNLELGFPLCFYEGMSQAAKHGLQFVFPVYLWLIVTVITFLSRYSDTLAKLVGADCSKVFVTLIYFAYTKLQRTSTDVFIYAIIGTNNNNNYFVWFYDGGERYFRGKHLILCIVSIFFLLFITTPYMFFTLLSQWCLHNSWVSRHFKPLIDATLAPFKDRWRFWFGLRLLIINLLILISIVVTSFNAGAVTYAHLVIITLLLVFQAHVKPYKSKLLHYLDLFFLINYVLFLIGCLFIFDILMPSKEQERVYVTSVEVIIIGSAFVVFIVTIVCHIIIRVRKFYGEGRGGRWSPNKRDEGAETEMDDVPSLNSIHSSNYSDEQRPGNVTLTVIDIRGGDDEGADQLRESLLGDY